MTTPTPAALAAAKAIQARPHPHWLSDEQTAEIIDSALAAERERVAAIVKACKNVRYIEHAQDSGQWDDPDWTAIIAEMRAALAAMETDSGDTLQSTR